MSVTTTSGVGGPQHTIATASTPSAKSGIMSGFIQWLFERFGSKKTEVQATKSITGRVGRRVLSDDEVEKIINKSNERFPVKGLEVGAEITIKCERYNGKRGDIVASGLLTMHVIPDAHGTQLVTEKRYNELRKEYERSHREPTETATSSATVAMVPMELVEKRREVSQLREEMEELSMLNGRRRINGRFFVTLNPIETLSLEELTKEAAWLTKARDDHPQMVKERERVKALRIKLDGLNETRAQAPTIRLGLEGTSLKELRREEETLNRQIKRAEARAIASSAT